MIQAYATQSNGKSAVNNVGLNVTRVVEFDAPIFADMLRMAFWRAPSPNQNQYITSFDKAYTNAGPKQGYTVFIYPRPETTSSQFNLRIRKKSNYQLAGVASVTIQNTNETGPFTSDAVITFNGSVTPTSVISLSPTTMDNDTIVELYYQGCTPPPPGEDRENPLYKFHKNAVAGLKLAGVLRNMDWRETNRGRFGDEHRKPLMSVDDLTAYDGGQSDDEYGSSLGQFLDLCEVCNADPWICFPHSSQSSLIAAEIQTLKTWLNSHPGRKPYIEFSNEVWNPGTAFAQTYQDNTSDPLWPFASMNRGHIISPDGFFDEAAIGGGDYAARMFNCIDSLENAAVIKAYDFDGIDDFVDCGDLDSFTFGDGATDSPFSIAAHIKMDDATNFSIAGKEYQFEVGSDDKLRIIALDDSSGGWIGRSYNTALTGSEGSWIHVTVTYDGSESSSGFKLYLDGVRVDDTNQESGSYTAMENTSEVLSIGKIGSFYADGQMRNVCMWSKELTLNEVTFVYTEGADGADPTTDEQVVDYWFDDIHPTLAIDYAGGFLHGTKNGVTRVGNDHVPGWSRSDYVEVVGWQAANSGGATTVKLLDRFKLIRDGGAELEMLAVADYITWGTQSNNDGRLQYLNNAIRSVTGEDPGMESAIGALDPGDQALVDDYMVANYPAEWIVELMLTSPTQGIASGLTWLTGIKALADSRGLKIGRYEFNQHENLQIATHTQLPNWALECERIPHVRECRKLMHEAQRLWDTIIGPAPQCMYTSMQRARRGVNFTIWQESNPTLEETEVSQWFRHTVNARV